MKQESLTGSPEERRWPFAETPGEFTNRLASAYNAFGTLLAAVRYVLIEEPPTFDAAASPPPPAEPALPELTDEQIMEVVPNCRFSLLHKQALRNNLWNR
jgi:hypothetical protein